eukprot:3395249-Prorocentrum_lima.AAC.1
MCIRDRTRSGSIATTATITECDTGTQDTAHLACALVACISETDAQHLDLSLIHISEPTRLDVI